MADGDAIGIVESRVWCLFLFYLVRSAVTLVVKELGDTDGDGVLVVMCEVYEQRKEKVQRAQNSNSSTSAPL
jgi:hypothetical protein